MSANCPWRMPADRWRGGSPCSLDWGAFLDAKRQELTRLNKAYRENLTK